MALTVAASYTVPRISAPPAPGRGLVDGDVEALVTEVHRAQEGLFAQVAAAAVARVPQHQPVQSPSPAAHAATVAPMRIATTNTLAGAPGPQQFHGGPHGPLPGRRPVRVAGPAGRITGAVVVDLETARPWVASRSARAR